MQQTTFSHIQQRTATQLLGSGSSGLYALQFKQLKKLTKEQWRGARGQKGQTAPGGNQEGAAKWG